MTWCSSTRAHGMPSTCRKRRSCAWSITSGSCFRPCWAEKRAYLPATAPPNISALTSNCRQFFSSWSITRSAASTRQTASSRACCIVCSTSWSNTIYRAPDCMIRRKICGRTKFCAMSVQIFRVISACRRWPTRCLSRRPRCRASFARRPAFILPIMSIRYGWTMPRRSLDEPTKM